MNGQRFREQIIFQATPGMRQGIDECTRILKSEHQPKWKMADTLRLFVMEGLKKYSRMLGG